MASEKWEVGLKRGFTFLKYQPQCSLTMARDKLSHWHPSTVDMIVDASSSHLVTAAVKLMSARRAAATCHFLLAVVPQRIERKSEREK